MHVYVVIHRHTDGSESICGIWCTLKQAKYVCEHHPVEDDMIGVGVRKLPLYGFPYGEAVFGLLLVIFLGLRVLGVF